MGAGHREGRSIAEQLPVGVGYEWRSGPPLTGDRQEGRRRGHSGGRRRRASGSRGNRGAGGARAGRPAVVRRGRAGGGLKREVDPRGPVAGRWRASGGGVARGHRQRGPVRGRRLRVRCVGGRVGHGCGRRGGGPGLAGDGQRARAVGIRRGPEPLGGTFERCTEPERPAGRSARLAGHHHGEETVARGWRRSRGRAVGDRGGIGSGRERGARRIAQRRTRRVGSSHRRFGERGSRHRWR